MITKIILCAMFAMACMPCVAQDDTLVVSNASKVTIITNDSLQKIRIDGTTSDPDFRYESTIMLVDSNYVSDVSINKDRWEVSLPFGKNNVENWVEHCCTTHLGVGWNTGVSTPEKIDFSMGSSWEIFWTIAQWDYTPYKSHNTWSLGLGVDWRNYRMTNNQRFVKTDYEHILVTDYPTNATPTFSRIKVFSLQMPLLYTYSIGKGFCIGGGPVVNLNLYSSLKTKYKIDGEKFKDTDKGAQVNPITVDFMGIIVTPGINLYVKYSPCNLFKSNYGPKFQTLSVGIYL